MDTALEINAAGDAARAELTDIATNPANARHAGYLRNDPEVSAYLDTVYKRAYPGKMPSEGLSSDRPPEAKPVEQQHASRLPEETVAHTEIDTMLRRTFGDEYDITMRDMRLGAGPLFGDEEGQALLEKLSQRIIDLDLGPEAEVAGIRYLAHLGQLV